MSTTSTAAEFDTYTPRPRYECTRGGVLPASASKR